MSERKYQSYFNKSYTTDYPCIIESKKKGKHFAYCVVCRKHFSIAHKGKNDALKHIETSSHMDNQKRSELNQKLNFATENNDAVTRAECLFSLFILEHNLPLSCADHASILFKKMFPDSAIAKKYGCARTKTSCIIGEMGKSTKTDLINSMKNGSFSISTDGSNKSAKYYPIVVTHLSMETNKIESSLYGVPVLVGDSTGENISKLIIDSLKKENIPLENCLALSVDNAYVMTGKQNGVFGFLKNDIEHLVCIGCPCHLMNLAARKGTTCLPGNIDDYLVDIYYYFQRSCKRQEKFQNMFDKETRKILKHVSTRWLSLTKCLVRLLDQWDHLVIFFKDEVQKNKSVKISKNLQNFVIPKKAEMDPISSRKRQSDDNTVNANKKSCRKNLPSKEISKAHKTQSTQAFKSFELPDHHTNHILTREERIFMFLSNDSYKAISSFLIFTLPIFDKANLSFQTNKPIIHIARSLMLDFLKELLSKFVLASVVKNATSVKYVDYYSIENQKHDEDLVIGRTAEKIVSNLKPSKKTEFYSYIRDFFVAACDYVIQKFPIDDALFINSEVANLQEISEASFSKVRFFIEKYKIAVRVIGTSNEDEACDVVQAEFCSLQHDEIPKEILDEERADVQWHLIGQLKNCNGSFKYERISQLMLLILTIPHSNAECERIFSFITKIATQFRCTMSQETLENLLICKSNLQGQCFEQKFSNDFLKRAKSATSNALQRK